MGTPASTAAATCTRAPAVCRASPWRLAPPRTPVSQAGQWSSAPHATTAQSAATAGQSARCPASLAQRPWPPARSRHPRAQQRLPQLPWPPLHTPLPPRERQPRARRGPTAALRTCRDCGARLLGAAPGALGNRGPDHGRVTRGARPLCLLARAYQKLLRAHQRARRCCTWYVISPHRRPTSARSRSISSCILARWRSYLRQRPVAPHVQQTRRRKHEARTTRATHSEITVANLLSRADDGRGRRP